MTHPAHSNLHVARRLRGIFAAASVIATMAGAGIATAQDARIEGSWAGGGRVRFPSGDTERANCRANFSRESATVIRMTATCATPSARVAQSARLQQVSANSFSGTFRNPEFDISGSINISVSGNKLNASLSGGGGSASLALSR